MFYSYDFIPTGVDTSSTQPQNVNNGYLWFNTTNNTLNVFINGNWYDVSSNIYSLLNSLSTTISNTLNNEVNTFANSYTNQLQQLSYSLSSLSNALNNFYLNASLFDYNISNILNSYTNPLQQSSSNLSYNSLTTVINNLNTCVNNLLNSYTTELQLFQKLSNDLVRDDDALFNLYTYSESSCSTYNNIIDISGISSTLNNLMSYCPIEEQECQQLLNSLSNDYACLNNTYSQLNSITSYLSNAGSLSNVIVNTSNNVSSLLNNYQSLLIQVNSLSSSIQSNSGQLSIPYSLIINNEYSSCGQIVEQIFNLAFYYRNEIYQSNSIYSSLTNNYNSLTNLQNQINTLNSGIKLQPFDFSYLTNNVLNNMFLFSSISFQVLNGYYVYVFNFDNLFNVYNSYFKSGFNVVSLVRRPIRYYYEGTNTTAFPNIDENGYYAYYPLMYHADSDVVYNSSNKTGSFTVAIGPQGPGVFNLSQGLSLHDYAQDSSVELYEIKFLAGPFNTSQQVTSNLSVAGYVNQTYGTTTWFPPDYTFGSFSSASPYDSVRTLYSNINVFGFNIYLWV